MVFQQDMGGESSAMRLPIDDLFMQGQIDPPKGLLRHAHKEAHQLTSGA
jgi:hypothetical protein